MRTRRPAVAEHQRRRGSKLWTALLLAALTCLGLAGGTGRAANLPQPDSLAGGTNRAPLARVVIVEDPQATDFFQPNLEHVRAMMRRGITNFTHQGSVAAAWRALVSPREVVGLKVYSPPGALTGTRLSVVASVIEGLLEAGLPATNIVVWDKRLDELQQAGFFQLASRYGVRVESSATVGFDPAKYYENPLLGNLVYSDEEFGRDTGGVTGRKSFVSRLLTRQVTKIINISPLLNNDFTGVSGNLFSLALGSVDNTLRFELNGSRLSVAVPEIYALPSLSDHVVLNITDALLCQYLGNRTALLHYTAAVNELWFSRDPVALDVLAIQELNRQRQRSSLSRSDGSLELYRNAALLELGVCDLNRVAVETLR